MVTEIDLLFPTAESAISDDRIATLYERHDPAQPWLRANFVSSVDGAATRDGLSGGLSGHADKRVFDILRTLCDVVLLGAETMRAEGYGPMRVDSLAEHRRMFRGLAPQPVLAIVSGSLNLDPASTAFTDAPSRPIVFTTAGASRSRRIAINAVADVVVCGETELDVTAMLAELGGRGLMQVHCEGGPRLFSTLLEANAVDELCLTISPMIQGGNSPRIDGGPLALGIALDLGHILVGEGFIILRYTRARG
jgi:riboflavin biosynthesis pyrimidine reductase